MTPQHQEPSGIDIRPVVSRADLKTFIGLPIRLYADFAEYVPPLTMDISDILDPKKGSFFKHGEVQYWMAFRNGEPVGRISAQLDFAQPEGTFDDAGLFGCFDAIDDKDVAKALIEVAEEWLISKGRARAIGPFTLSMNELPGLLVEGQEEPPLLMASWHPLYLEALLGAQGYAACRDLHYWRASKVASDTSVILERLSRLPDIPGMKLRHIQRKTLDNDVKIMIEIYNDAWKNNWGFVPLLPVDVEALVTSLRLIIKPEDGIIMEYEGKPVGIALVLPNLNEIFSDLGPNPSPIGWLKLAYRLFTHKFKSHRVMLLGFSTQFNGTVKGAYLAMRLLSEIVSVQMAIKDNSGYVEAGWVLDNNEPLRKILVNFGFSTSRTYRLYDKQIADEPERNA